MPTTAYLDRAALVARISESDLLQRLAAADGEPKLAQAIADANSLADLHVGTRHAVPLATVPPALARAVADIAVVMFAASTGGGATAAEQERDAAARKLFAALADGSVRLGLEGADDILAPAPRITSAPRRFTRRTLGGVL